MIILAAESLVMKQLFIMIISACFMHVVYAQQDTAVMNDITRFQKELLAEYASDSTSPLSAKAKKTFKGIHYYTANMQYVVTAKFIRTAQEKIFDMPTSGKISKPYVKYGEVHFTMQGKAYKLSVYQSVSLASQRKYRNYLFIPFRDATSGKETYGGGRYIDLTIPQTDTMVINFNKAYQPYCAYTEGFNCPIPPPENYLPVKIEAGVKY